MRYEYQTTFAPVAYEKEKRGIWFFKKEEVPSSPVPESLYDDKQYQEQIQRMGRDGWELVSVQPLLRGVYRYNLEKQGSYGLGYSLTAGYYLFWKKQIG